MDSKFYLTLMVLGLTAVIRTKATVLDGRQDDSYQQDLIGADYTSNRLDEPSQEYQPPFYYNNNFDCTKHQYAYGMYADMDFQCQVYHVCHNNRKESFLCPQGTLFNQRLLVCDHWHSVNCRDTPSFYHANQELGKVSNKTKYYDEPYSHRRLPEDYGQRSPYSPSYTTVWQEQQFPSSRERSTQFPSAQSTTETPVDSYHTRNQVGYPGRSQSGIHQPQAPRVQTINYGRPQTGSQFGQRDHRTLGHDYGDSGVNAQGPQQTYSNGQPKPESGSSGFVRGNQQSRFNQAGIGAPGTQQNRGLTFTHYSQSGGRRSQSQDGKVNNTWPYDRNEQRNDIQGLQHGRQPPSSWRYGQNYPENALLGSRYNGQKPSVSQYGQQAPGSLHSRHQPVVSHDGQPQSQVVTSSLTYDNQQPSTTRTPNARTRPFGRSPGSFYDHGPTTNLQHGQRQPELGSSGFRSGRHDQTFTQYGQQPSQPGSPRPPATSHHPFTSHGGQIHPQDGTPDSTSSRHQPPRTQTPGYDHQQPSITLEHGPQQPDIGASGSPYGKGPSNLQDGQQQFRGQTSGDQRQSVTHYRQNQSHITISGPPYNQQQPIIPSTRYSQTGTSIGEHGQLSTTQVGPQYKPPLDVQRNNTRLYNQQNPATRFQVHQPQVSENTRKKLEFGYSGQSLNRQVDGKPVLVHGTEQNASSGSEDKKQGSQFDRDNRPTSYNRDPKAFQNPGLQQSWNLRGIQASAPQFNSQEHNSQASQYGRQEPANAQGTQYSWQKPGSSQYSFQQPQYRNLHSSRNPADPSQLTPSSSNDSSPGFSGVSNSFNALGQSHVSKYENRFWNYQSGQSHGRNSTGTVPTEAESGGELDTSKGSQDKNLKPILVYQHHIPVTINGNTTGGSHNKTEISRHQQVPVYKVYYVKGDRKDGAAN